MMKLQGYQQALDQAQRPKGDNQNQRAPNYRVQPIGRLIFNLDSECEADDQRSGKQDEEHGGPVARVCKGEIETAYVAARLER